MKRRSWNIVLKGTFVIPLLLMFACDATRVYEEWQDLPAMSWHEDSACVFSFEMEDTTALYNMNFGLRNTNLYPFQNLWLLTSIEGPDGFLFQDTIKVVVANKSGQWYGKRSASIYTYTMPLYRNLSIPKAGAYDVRMKHGMRREKLEGVASIGFRIEYVE